MPSVWTPEAERALLLAAIQEADLKPSKAVWDAVATQLEGAYTANAIRQRYYKIRNDAVAGGSPMTPVTKPRAKSTASSSSGTNKRKKAVSEESTNAASDSTTNGEEAAAKDAETPSKKLKTEDGEDAEGTNGVVANGE